MSISYDNFLNWAESRFGDVIAKGDEIKINSPFCEDYKHHLWCNPSGGKHDRPNGVFRCWKTDKKGSLVSLVMIVDKCSYDEALERLGGSDTTLADLERRLEEFWANKQPAQETVLAGTLSLPEQTFWISELSEDNFWRAEAEVYLLNRRLPPQDFMICTGGNYKNRIIIPYYDKDKKLIYFTGRFLEDRDKIPKYMVPDNDSGVGKADVIYMADSWPPDHAKICITEGEFDAKSISISGLFACALGGKSISDKQIAMLLPYVPVLCLDADSKKIDAGGNAMLEIGDALKEKGFDEVYYVRPPKLFKDWNKMLTEVGPKVINAYIKQHEKLYTDTTSLELKLQRA